MKTNRQFLLLSITIISIFLCTANVQGKTILSNEVNGLTLSVDGRQEIISIIQYLGGYFRLNKLELDYKNSVNEYFGDYREHEAVKYLQELTKQGFSYDAPAGAMLYFSDDFEYNKTFTPYLLKRIGGEENAKEFVRLIKKFAEDTKFSIFLEQQNPLYKQILEELSEQLKDFNEISTIEGFFGKKQNSYNIILSILNAGNYGPSIENNGKVDIYSIMSAKGTNNGHPVFGNLNNIRYLVWHEFGHSFVNPLTEKHSDFVAQYSDLQAPIKTAMEKQAYGNWNTIVNEHVIRAVTTKLAEEKFGKIAAEVVKKQEINRSFYYVTPLCNYLDEYIQNRDKYKTFEEFYPTLIEKAFNDARENNYQAGHLKNLNNTYNEVEFVVVSSNEKDPNIQNEILDYVTMLKKRFWKDKLIISDEEALEMDLSKSSFMVYGTIENNKVLQKFKNHFPISLSKESIIADKKYETTNGKAIFNLKNPLNPDKHIVVYTAQKPEGIPGINNVFHGGTNYIVFESREKVLKKGFFTLVDRKWECE